MSHGSNLLLRAARLAGSWRIEGDRPVVSWFPGERPAAARDVRAAVERLARLLAGATASAGEG